MNLHDLSPAKGSKHARRRVGRGPGSGLGKTAGRGHKGQKSRTGYSSRPGFEGGQMPLIRRVPKRGFTNLFKTEYAVVNLAQLAELAGDDQTEMTPELMAHHGLARKGLPVKVLGNGEVARPLTVSAHKFSKSARAKIEQAGGRCEELPA
ncbi:MAG TPA: 50S ribosomal protein L15 [Thermoanaerobaculia bacterium]|nr:50S ribosomal protein L15 [Thermoanaerobaculia bacterium]